MYLIFTASKDTYITNKIIDSSFRATDANVGQAGTIDIFKLYDEYNLVGDTGSIELSRGLVKFDLDPIKQLTGSIIDINDSSFRVLMKMSNLIGGTAVPSDFNLEVAPLSRSFDEGSGRDLASFADLDVANFVTSSVSGGSAVTWHVTGANAGGLLGSSDIDFITSGTIDGTLTTLTASQNFLKGTEDLLVDVTTIISATLDGKIPDYGFRIAFKPSEETDQKSRFVKRFASTNSANPLKKPSLSFIFNDSITDTNTDFVFDITGSQYLNNFVRGDRYNFISGAAGTEITGDSCMNLKIKKGQFEKLYDVSQVKRGTNQTLVNGLYKSDFAVSLFDTTRINNENETLLSFINASGSVDLQTFWESKDGTVGFHTGSMTIRKSKSTTYSANPGNIIIQPITLPSRMQHDEVLKISFFVTDRSIVQKVYKVPYRTKSAILQNAFYQIRDIDSGEIVIPFNDDTQQNGTKLSSDSTGIYFILRTITLPRGKNFAIDIKIKDFAQEQIFLNVGQGFKVE